MVYVIGKGTYNYPYTIESDVQYQNLAITQNHIRWDNSMEEKIVINFRKVQQDYYNSTETRKTGL